ncbi:MAG: glycosyltransferase family 2 protein [Pseudomonadota bacterium]
MKQDRPVLSFAIPTYNFGKFIGETVRSIEHGLRVLSPQQIEIVILDGGSRDDTDTVVAELVQTFGNIRYIKNAERCGIDKDLDSVSRMTNGQYTWLFSADDLLDPGWDETIVPILKQTPDIVLVSARLCDVNMNPLRQNPIFKTSSDSTALEVTLAGDEHSLTHYLEESNTLEALFSYMSAVIVRSDHWKSNQGRVDYFGTCWAHCATLIPQLLERAKVFYTGRSLIQKRGGNDSFMENGLVARIGIAIYGWSRLIVEFFPARVHREILYARLRNDISIALFLYAKVNARSREEVSRLDDMARVLYAGEVRAFKPTLHYWMYRLFPSSRWIAAIVRRMLPALIRVRHRMRERRELRAQ